MSPRRDGAPPKSARYGPCGAISPSWANGNSASRDSRQPEEFEAVSPIGKQMVVQVFSRATARNAKRFLETVRAQLPFPLVSAQVDGGGEFRADF